MKKWVYCLFVYIVSSILIFGCGVSINPVGRINISFDSRQINPGSGEVDLGKVLIGETSPEFVFKIENGGKSTLELLADPDAVSIIDEDSCFYLEQSTILNMLNSKDSTSFAIKFTPTDEGVKSATITINSTDKDVPQFTFTVKAEGVTPDINITQNGADLVNGVGEYDFGKNIVGETSSEVTFTIENKGTGQLDLTGEPELISISGADSSDFSINQTGTKSTLEAGESTTFTVLFTPDGIFGKTAKISIASSDLSKNPYTFNLVGEGVTPTEINVKQDTSDIPSGTGEFDFGQIDVGDSSSDIVFTIENLGTNELYLTGFPKMIEISGLDAAMFAIDDTNTQSSVAFQASTTFSIKFTPMTFGAKSATISIANNDADENPYTFTIKGIGLAPDMVILDTQLQGIPNGTGSFDFGDLLVSGNNASSFTIQNNGNANLELTNTPMIEITGTGASAFSVKTAPTSPITAGANTTFEIEFAPTATQQYSATISIANNDPYSNPYTFTVTGNGISPEIEVLDPNSQSMQSGSGSYGFGGIMINTSKEETFTIKNTGTADLVLSGSPAISITGAGASAFTVTAQPSTPITPASDTTFKIKFMPTVNQLYSATVSIINSDLDENPFEFTITGTGLAPEINIVDSGSNKIASGSGTFNFNGLLINTTTEETFTIQNIGTGELVLNGSPLVSITGSGASAYTVTSQPTSPIAVGSDTTFKVKFAPTANQLYQATISISNTDTDENPYTFTIEGTGVVPEINIVDSGSNAIASGSGVFSFSSVGVTASKEETFTIQNIGAGELLLTGSPIVTITGSGASAYSVTAQPTSPVAAGSDTTFKIKFAPTTAQLYQATISIANTDSDENPYTFTIEGTGLEPEINIVDSGSNTLASGSGTFDFGSVGVTASKEETFTIQNIGLGELILTGSPIVTITGTGASMYSVTAQPTSPVAASSDTTFKIKFAPTTAQLYQATVSIANSDSDENPYTFTIEGTGLEPEINIIDSGLNTLLSGSGTFSYGSVGLNTSKEETFAIQNIGLGELLLTGSPIISITGTGASAFSVSSQPTSPVAASASTSFKIKFTPTAEQLYQATISIANSDTNENPYTFTIDGTGFALKVTFDFNGDGYEDTVIGSNFDNEGGTYAGAAYIYLGKASHSASLGTVDADIKIIGDAANDQFGCAVAGIGDFNKDGYDDVLVGAKNNSEGGRNAGAAYIFFGNASPSAKMYASNCDMKMVGESMGDSFGIYVSSAGDFNDDGYVDVLISAMFSDDNGGDSGSAYIFYGDIHPPSKVHANRADIVINGENNFDMFGYMVSRAGDFNDDGVDDILVGSYGNDEGGGDAGAVYVFFGSTSPSALISASNADIKIVNSNSRGFMACSYAGDFNNDNIGDIMYSGRLSGYTRIYIYYGKASPSRKLYPTSADVKITSGSDNTQLGIKLSNIGDVNNDNIDDIAIDDNACSLSTGRVYVFYGSSSPTSAMVSSNANIIIIGENSGDQFGTSISSIGDFNGDGIKDFIIGTYRYYNNGYNAGAVYIFYGKSNFSSSVNASSADIKITGDALNQFGVSVSGSE